MEDKPGKIIGICLLFLGVSIILATLYFSYNIFTAKSPVPEIFSMDGKKVDSGSDSSSGIQKEIKDMFQKQIQQQLGNILPSNSIPQLLNLISWSIFCGIAVFGGSQIANIGTKLLR